MAKYILQQGFITQKIDNEIVIFSGEEEILFTLNETANHIFNKIKQGWNAERIIQNLKETYEVSDKQAENDVKSFIEKLKKKKIIVETG